MNKDLSPTPLRLWPGVAAAAAGWLAWYLVPIVMPDRTSRVVHESIANAGQGMLLYILALPLMGLALVRTGGITGDMDLDLHWRWTPTPEERLLAQGEPTSLPPAPPVAAATPEAGLPAPASPSPAPASEEAAEKIAAPAAAEQATSEWPGFRGPRRDGVVRGVRIETDWSQQPPVELWRRPIGPGWSSFAVDGDLLYTREQRGDDEIVSAYHLTTGEDGARKWKGGRYGHGQLVLLPEQDLLLVLSEEGELALVNATPDQFTERARFKAIDGKTWNHPVLVGDVLLVRNGEEMAAFRLTRAK